MTALQTLAPEAITLRIATVRGQRVIVDADLAALYGVETKRFNEAVKRNLAKFPTDFMFTLTTEEFQALRSQFATSNDQAPGRGGRRYAPRLSLKAVRSMTTALPNESRRCGWLTTDRPGNMAVDAPTSLARATSSNVTIWSVTV
jgi:ORF6N domain